MPKLPEVETTRRGLAPLTVGRTVDGVEVRKPMLRWPVADELASLAGRDVLALERRAKWLLWRFEHGTLLWHLGMSGSFRRHPGPTTTSTWRSATAARSATRIRAGSVQRCGNPATTPSSIPD